MSQITKRQKAAHFRLEVPGDNEVKSRMMEKINKVRTKMMENLQRPVNHADIIETLLDHWLDETSDIQGLQVRSNLKLFTTNIAFTLKSF